MFVIANHFQPILIFAKLRSKALRGLHSRAGMSDPNKFYNRRNGNSRTVKITFFHTGLINYLTNFGQNFPSDLFSQSFTDENDGKVKNRRT
jgi:hypothetical protein